MQIPSDTPPLGLGTFKIGRTRGIKYPAAYPLPTDAPRRWTLRLEQDLSGAQVSQ